MNVNRLKGTKTKYNLLLEVIVMLIRWKFQWERHIYCIKLFPLSWGLKASWMQYGHDHRSWASLHWPLQTLSKSFFTWSIFQPVQKLSIICQLGICHHLPLEPLSWLLQWSSISCRWCHWSRVIACCIFDTLKFFFIKPTRTFSPATWCWDYIWRSLIAFA